MRPRLPVALMESRPMLKASRSVCDAKVKAALFNLGTQRKSLPYLRKGPQCVSLHLPNIQARQVPITVFEMYFANTHPSFAAIPMISRRFAKRYALCLWLGNVHQAQKDELLRTLNFLVTAPVNQCGSFWALISMWCVWHFCLFAAMRTWRGCMQINHLYYQYQSCPCCHCWCFYGARQPVYWLLGQHDCIDVILIFLALLL